MLTTDDLALPNLKIGILASHPIQYQAPLFRALAKKCTLTVYYAHRQTPQAHAEAGFGVAFEWDIDLFSGYESKFLRNVARSPSAGRFFGCDTPDIATEVTSRRFDAFLVMGWNLKAFWQATMACRRRGVPVMVRGDSQLGTPRSWTKRIVKSGLYPWLLGHFDASLYVGARNRDYLESYRVPADRLFFSPHCIDVAEFAAASDRVDRFAIRASWGLPAGHAVVLFVGKMKASKRPDELLQSMARLRSRGIPAALVWAGDGPERPELARECSRLDIPSKFLGFQNQSSLPLVYAAADVMALPSEEPWGLVVNEALACGTPCVVSDACGCAPDMVVSGRTGEVFPLGDLDALATALARAIQIPRRSREMSYRSDRHSPEAAARGVLEAAYAKRRSRLQ